MSAVCLKAPKATGLKKPRPLHKCEQMKAYENITIKVEKSEIANTVIKQEPVDYDYTYTTSQRSVPSTPEKAKSNINESGDLSKFYTATMEYAGDHLVVASTSIKTLMRITTLVTNNLDCKLVKIETSDKVDNSRDTSFVDDSTLDITPPDSRPTTPVHHKPARVKSVVVAMSAPEKRKYTAKQLVRLSCSVFCRKTPKGWSHLHQEFPDIYKQEPEYFNPQSDYFDLNEEIFSNKKSSTQPRSEISTLGRVVTISNLEEDLKHPYGHSHSVVKGFGGYYVDNNTDDTSTLRKFGRQNSGNNNSHFEESAPPLRDFSYRNKSGNNNTEERWLHDHYENDLSPLRVVVGSNSRRVNRLEVGQSTLLNNDQHISHYGLINDPLRIVDVDGYE